MDEDDLRALKIIIMAILIIPTWIKIKKDCEISNKITNQIIGGNENAISREN